MKRFVASVAIMLLGMSTTVAQATCCPGANQDLARVIGPTIGALIGSSVGDGRSQTLATGAAAMLGGGIGASLSRPRPATAPEQALVHQLHEHRNHVIDAAVTGQITMPSKARPVVRRHQTLTQCKEIEQGTLACQDASSTWRILRQMFNGNL